MVQPIEETDEPPARAGGNAPSPVTTTAHTPGLFGIVKADLPSPPPDASVGLPATKPDGAKPSLATAHRPFTPPPTPAVVSHAIGEEMDGLPVCAEKKPLLDATEAVPPTKGDYLPPGAYPGAAPWPTDTNGTAKRKNSKGKNKSTKTSNPRPALPHEPKLRFSTLELDPKFDDYPVLTRMWLSVRDSDETDKWITYHNITVMLDFACWAAPHAWSWLRCNDRAMYLVMTHMGKRILGGISRVMR